MFRAIVLALLCGTLACAHNGELSPELLYPILTPAVTVGCFSGALAYSADRRTLYSFGGYQTDRPGLTDRICTTTADLLPNWLIGNESEIGPRARAAACALDDGTNRYYIMGGLLNGSVHATADVWIYTPEETRWDALGVDSLAVYGISGVYGATLFAQGSNLFLYGGFVESDSSPPSMSISNTLYRSYSGGNPPWVAMACVGGLSCVGPTIGYVNSLYDASRSRFVVVGGYDPARNVTEDADTALVNSVWTARQRFNETGSYTRYQAPWNDTEPVYRAVGFVNQTLYSIGTNTTHFSVHASFDEGREWQAVQYGTVQTAATDGLAFYHVSLVSRVTGKMRMFALPTDTNGSLALRHTSYVLGCNTTLWTCACPSGFTNNASSIAHEMNCTDVNECAVDNGGCDTASQECENVPGSWKCNQLASSDVVDICSPNDCQNNGTCTALNSTAFSCECAQGFEGTLCNTTSECIVNECLTANGGCPTGTTCVRISCFAWCTDDAVAAPVSEVTAELYALGISAAFLALGGLAVAWMSWCGPGATALT